ncbi:Polyadenylate-binding protein-interacting protein 5 [Cardamine amara subsp. amara]|uniref:Polyadenylate-binding protein-interacting protein 5 n=1 Tax=Cardamine amara subsp. amara TaxID=228776 RepID=A0ABD1A5X4_CARAN
MKPGTFALNPHAAAYVPISKRVDYGGSDDGLMFANSPTHMMQGQQISFSGVQVSMPKTSSEMAYKQIRDDDDDDDGLDMEMDIDMDIEFLLVTFPGLSQESITDVYLANSGDLEATIEMLNQLEIYSAEAQEHLPETLDIGDITESGPSTSSKGSKQKNAATEVVASSS